ncbi:MAG: hypothetical protein IJ320_06670 [Phascolarctobacterium sp.]|nr:hypothetical protein [Acidaminococcaceae bacterium]MBQ7884018.1 hypothetical protein [Phascolarctobacterium sp.]
MIYTDSGLINKDGSINLQYAFEWMCVLKEEYDMREFLKDMNDIEWLLSAPVDKIDLMQAKFDELSGKYSLYVNIVNIFNYRRGMNRIKSSLREQLRLYYYHLPLFALLKHQVTKVFELEVNKMICECA